MCGVGKTSWARQTFPEAHHFDLLDEGLFQDYLRDAHLFGRESRRKKIFLRKTSKDSTPSSN
jgi:hypothetical protein